MNFMFLPRRRAKVTSRQYCANVGRADFIIITLIMRFLQTCCLGRMLRTPVGCVLFAASFCTGHINDRTEAEAIRLLIKERVEEEMWDGEEPDSMKAKKLKKKRSEARQSDVMTRDLEGDTPPSSHHLFSHFFFLLPFSFLPPPPIEQVSDFP